MFSNSQKAINIAKLVWAFDISPGKNEGTKHPPAHNEVNDSVETQWTNGFLTAPKPFPLTIVLRSKRHREIIAQEILNFQDLFKSYED